MSILLLHDEIFQSILILSIFKRYNSHSFDYDLETIRNLLFLFNKQFSKRLNNGWFSDLVNMLKYTSVRYPIHTFEDSKHQIEIHPRIDMYSTPAQYKEAEEIVTQVHRSNKFGEAFAKFLSLSF